MLSDINFFKIIGKTIMAYIVFAIATIVIFLAIIVSHCLVVCFTENVDFLTAITPLHAAITTNNWNDAYFMVRQTVILELPVVGILDKFLIAKNSISFFEICDSVVKAIISGFFSYILCRFNFLISSEKHNLLFIVMCGVWDAVAALGSVVLVSWIGILDVPSSRIVLGLIVILMFILNAFMPYNSLNNHHLMLVGMKKCFIVNMKNLFGGVLDGIYISISVWLLHVAILPNMVDWIEVILLFMIVCFVTTVIYQFVKRNLLKL